MVNTQSNDPSPPERSSNSMLHSWKEIASHLRRGERTAQRWEKTEGLPVYRHFHGRLGSVYSYKDELDLWWTRRRQQLEAQPEQLPGKIMLAVLPFSNLTGDSDQEYFSNGLTEELITRLGGLHPHRLGVISRTSVMQYKGATIPIPAIARDLGVSFVLEGSVRREAGRVRVHAQLIQATDQTHLWTATYEREFSGVFAVQSEIAGEVAHSLALELRVPQAAGVRRATNMAAYEAYLRGRHFCSKRTGEALRKGMAYFNQAISLDRSYSLAYAGMAECYVMLCFYAQEPPLLTMPQAKQAALKALDIDESIGEAHALLAEVKTYFEWDWQGADQEYKRAIELNPSDARARLWHACFLAINGGQREALDEIAQAQQLDPLSLIIQSWAAFLHYASGNYDEAIRLSRDALELDPSFATAHAYLGLAYEQTGMKDQARYELQTAMQLSGNNTSISAMLGHACALAGDRPAALEMIGQLQSRDSGEYVSSYDIAVIRAGLGDHDAALNALMKAYEERAIWLVLVKLDPRFKLLVTDSRFEKLVRRIGLANEPSCRSSRVSVRIWPH
jgi:TolB-like protein/Flp pilus assembly protein TadD